MRVTVMTFLMLLIMPTGVFAQEKNEISLLLNQARKECRNGRFGEGVNHAIDAGVKVRMNRILVPWRTVLDNCYLRWLRSSFRKCSKLDPTSISDFASIISKAKFSASPKVKKSIEKYMVRCVKQVQAQPSRRCTKHPELIRTAYNYLESLKKTAPKSYKRLRRAIDRAKKALGRCSGIVWRSMVGRCLKAPSVRLLTALDAMKEYAMPVLGSYGTESYRACVVASLKTARSMCSRGDTDHGAILMREGRKRLLTMKPKDEVLIKKSDEWAPECGLGRLKMTVTMEVKSPEFTFIIAGSGKFTVRKVKGTEVQACGDFSTTDFTSKTPKGCDLHVVVERDTTGLDKTILPKRICLTGKLETRKGVGQVLSLKFDTLVARTMFREIIQTKCPNAQVKIKKTHILEDLISRGDIFKVSLNPHPNARKKNYAFRNFARGVRVEWKSSWKYMPLK